MSRCCPSSREPRGVNRERREDTDLTETFHATRMEGMDGLILTPTSKHPDGETGNQGNGIGAYQPFAGVLEYFEYNIK